MVGAHRPRRPCDLAATLARILENPAAIRMLTPGEKQIARDLQTRESCKGSDLPHAWSLPWPRSPENSRCAA